MDKAYKSKDYSGFRSAGEEYQSPKKVGDKNLAGDSRAVMEEPFEGFKKTSGIAKKIMDKMKYAPKTVSYSEFTDTKRNAKLQSMVKGGMNDQATTGRMETPSMSKLPAGKKEKSFDIDVTKYSPRKAKG